jgi:hypothetical protein
MMTRFEVRDETAIGWDVKGQEVAKVPFTEAHVVREPFDKRYGAYRHNTT